jgi:hypothetical protein
MAQDYGVETSTLTEKSLLGGHPPVMLPATLSNAGETDWEAEAGTVLGIVTATGKYIGVDPDAETGEETAAAVLPEAITVPAGGTAATVVLVHGDVNKAALVWTHDGITSGEKTTAYASLKTAGIYAK